VRWDVRASDELAEDDDAASSFVLVENFQFNTRVGAGLPRLLAGVH
jgi:hypothetical protein